MARQRDAAARLIDNLQRKVRHIRVKETQARADGNKMELAGLQRNKENIEKMIDKVKKERKEGKLTLEKAFDYAEKAKEDPRYSADTKKIDEITRKLIGNEPFVNFGSMMEDPEIAQLFSDYSTVSMRYVGVSGEEAPRAEALKISQAAKEIAARRRKDLTEDQINMLNKITKDIETAMQSRGLEGVLYPIN